MPKTTEKLKEFPDGFPTCTTVHSETRQSSRRRLMFQEVDSSQRKSSPTALGKLRTTGTAQHQGTRTSKTIPTREATVQVRDKTLLLTSMSTMPINRSKWPTVLTREIARVLTSISERRIQITRIIRPQPSHNQSLLLSNLKTRLASL